jgi:hypothetical protein
MRRLLVIAVLLLATRTVHAQYNVPSQASSDSRVQIAGESEDDQQIATSPKKLAPGFELGASLDFLTTGDRTLGDQRVEFTDVVFFRVHGLIPIGKHAELFAGIDLLPKQPSFTDEHRWQGSLLGARMRVSKTLSAYVRGQLGPNLDHDGFWAIGEAAVQYKRHLAERVLFWESTVGGSYTQLMFDEQDTRFWQAEMLAQTGIAIRDRRGFFATWLMFGFHFPLLSRPTTEMPDAQGRALDPQVRVGMSFGGLIGVTRSLDLFVEASILDRGDLEEPATTLPILSGGFDQQRILFGFNKRFGKRKR